MKRIIVIISLLILSGCQEPSDKTSKYQENFEITGSEKEDLIKNTSDTIYESINRENSGSKEVTIEAIYKEGKDVILPEGRYQITGKLTGNVYINDRQGGLLFHDLIGPPPLGVESITIDVNGSHILHVDGFEQVVITPVRTKPTTELTSGIWKVGKDIEAGNYTITGNDLGYIEVFEQDNDPQVFEVIGNESQSITELELKSEQIIRVTGVQKLHLQAIK